MLLCFLHHFKTIGEFKLELMSANVQFWPKLAICFVPCTLQIRRMTLKNIGHPFYATSSFVSFHSHLWIHTKVKVRKCPIWGKICFDLCDLDLWPLTSTFCINVTSVYCDYAWKFHDDTMVGTLWKGVKPDGQNMGYTNRTVLTAAW